MNNLRRRPANHTLQENDCFPQRPTVTDFIIIMRRRFRDGDDVVLVPVLRIKKSSSSPLRDNKSVMSWICLWTGDRHSRMVVPSTCHRLVSQAQSQQDSPNSGISVWCVDVESNPICVPCLLDTRDVRDMYKEPWRHREEDWESPDLVYASKSWFEKWQYISRSNGW